MLVCRSPSKREKANWTHVGSTPSRHANLVYITSSTQILIMCYIKYVPVAKLDKAPRYEREDVGVQIPPGMPKALK